MKCPFCENPEDKVIDSRTSKEGNAIRRRRECLQCGKRFTSYERVEDVVPMVAKKDGRRESFNASKIKSGLLIACKKRPIKTDSINEIVDNIEKKLISESLRDTKFLGWRRDNGSAQGSGSGCICEVCFSIPSV